MSITITKRLDMVARNIPPVINLSQYDSDFTLNFLLYASTGTFTVEYDTTAVIRGTKKSGNGYSADVTLSTITIAGISYPSVTVTGDNQMTAVAGKNNFEITLKKNDKELSSANFILNVERAPLDADTIIDETVLRELDAIIDGADRAENAADAAEASAEAAAESAASIDFGLDPTPTQGSTNAVSSGGVYAALEDKADKSDVPTLHSNDYATLYNLFELGTADTSNGNIIYYTTTDDIRLIRDTALSLNAGDILIPMNGVRHRILKYTDGAWSRITNFSSERYTIETTGEYYLVLDYADGRVLTDPNTLLVDFCIVKENSVFRGFDAEITASVAALSSEVDSIVDSSDLFADFDEIPVINGTYYTGRVRDWGTSTNRVITQKTLVYPVDVLVTMQQGYTIAINELTQEYVFTGNQAASGTTIINFTDRCIVPKNTIFLPVIKKGNNETITAEEFYTAVNFTMYPDDLTTLTEKMDTLVKDYTYKVDGAKIDVTAQGMNAARLSYNPPTGENNSAQQSIAYYNGVIFQFYADGKCKLINFETGDIINTLEVGTGHQASASFSSEFYNPTDEFPILYVCDMLNNNYVHVYRVSRTDCTLIKTYTLPYTDAGYYQAACINKQTDTLYCVGYSLNSYVGDGEGNSIIVSAWDLSSATEQDGVYTPTLTKKVVLPWKKYLQFSQCLNNQIFVGFGAVDSTQPASLTDTVIWVIDCGTLAVKSILSDLPDNLRNAEIEGCDFIPNGRKYNMLTTQRANGAYWILDFE